MKIVEFFNEHAEHWDDDYTEYNIIRTAIANLSGAGQGSRVLDIACGTGVMFPEMLKLNIQELVGIDISNKMVEVAQKKFADKENVRVICKDLLEFNEENFDVAIMYNAYPHFLNKEATIEQVAKLLGPKGRFTVAHGAGRQVINQCHGNVPSEISTELRPAVEEAKKFEPWFNVDIICDTPYAYIISGTKR